MEGSAANTCPVCFSAEMHWAGGSLICVVCGSQSQDFAEETQEFQTGVDDTRYRRRTRLSAAADLRPRAEAAFPAAEVVETHLRCLQTGLQEQMRVLMDDMGMQADAGRVAYAIWSAHLKECAILDPEFASKLGEVVERQTNKSGGGEEVGDGEPRALRKALWAVIRDVVWEVLPPETMLAVALLAAVLLRDAVTPVDLVRWTLSGRLPLLALPHAAKEAVESAPAEFLLPLIQPQGTPSVHQIEMTAAKLAAKLGLRLPPLNVVALLQRAASALGMPQAAFVAAVKVWELLREGDDCCRLSTSPAAAPYAQLVAPLVVALKLLYGLDGASRPPLPQEVPPPPPDWQAWAAAAFARIADPCEHPLSVEQTLALPREAQQRYVAHLRHSVFGQTQLPPEFQELLSSLDSQSAPLSQNTDQPSQATEVSAAARDAAAAVKYVAVGTAATAATTADESADPPANRPAAVAATSDGTAGSRRHLQRAVAPERNGAAPGGGSRGSTADGGNDGNGPDKLMYTSSMRLRGQLAGHPDYIAVITVCAAYAWIKPKFLHRLVVELERDMLQAEAAATIAARKQPAAAPADGEAAA